jgi:hypothetical protein
MTGVRYPIEMVRGVPVVAAPAEIDASNAGWLEAALLTAHHFGHVKFVVDHDRHAVLRLGRSRCAVRAHTRALAQGGELRLVVPASALVLRVFAVTGLDRVIPNFADLDEALQPAPAAPAPPRPRRRRSKPGMRPPRTGGQPTRALPRARPDGGSCRMD